MKSFIIRQEKPSDYDEVYNLVKTAFATVLTDGSEPDEQDYLNDLRKKDTFIPELSLVAESDDGGLIGQIVLCRTVISTPQGELATLLLSPISVHPGYFRQGVARALVDESLRIAGEMGYKAVFLCGEPEIYGRLGFVPSYLHNIYHKGDESKTAGWSMVRELQRGALLGISGTVDTI